ncbi:hypothetical protein EXN51_26420 [Agrobacterium fabrum]|uniref:Uncharacterized protein n=1 Tax=Agrobacterium fabrum (strain C58 / ATCC 33970) TaxID=176299 RepID=A9CLA7_AGRFC|nr:hypothetical protein Atu5373 [Agrobacterium fabrum str. C58]KJX90010.1 hypothetical protein SY94_5413 [Agrobacterium tumefaciens]TRB22782.1 hypothetical protein EXN51_26420 [Agrobacterium fabrum]
MLVKGRDPFNGMPTIPSMQRLRISRGGNPKYDAGKAFGTALGIPGLAAVRLDLPPTWTEKGGTISSMQLGN